MDPQIPQTEQPAQDAPVLPSIIISQSVLDHIVAESLAHPPTETGQAMLGVEVDGYILVLAVLLDPNPNRQPGLFQQGGRSQQQMYDWYDAHWEAMRAASVGKLPSWAWGERVPVGQVPSFLNAPLTYVGDWHKHPGSYNTLSGTDMNQVGRIFSDPDDPDRRQFITPIITVHKGGTLRYDQEQMIWVMGTEVRMDWYFHRKGGNGYLPVQPVLMPDEQLPWIPPMPWHLQYPHMLNAEVSMLRHLGCSVSVNIREMDRDPVMEVLLGVDHPDWVNRVLMVTDWDYPRSAPRITLLPKGQGAQRLPRTRAWSLQQVRDWVGQVLYQTWNPRRPYLAELVQQLHQKGELTNEQQPVEQS